MGFTYNWNWNFALFIETIIWTGKKLNGEIKC